MPYLNLDDEYAEHPKHEILSDGAFRLLTAALCYCAHNLTDGFVPDHKIRRLTPNFKPSHLDELLTNHPERPDLLRGVNGFLVRDYLDWNKSAAWWTQKRAADAKRQRRHRDNDPPERGH